MGSKCNLYRVTYVLKESREEIKKYIVAVSLAKVLDDLMYLELESVNVELLDKNVTVKIL